MPVADQVAYEYPYASHLGAGRLALATSGGDAAAEPVFYAGGLRRPALAARLLLAVSDNAARRYYTPPGVLEATLAAADPIVSSDGERLRFESLSACCGVYVRADLMPQALERAPVSRGTTNVDFNAPMRASLARVRDAEAGGLLVGRDGVELARGSEVVRERRVRLPERWVRGLGEVQALQAEMAPVAEASGAPALRFVRSLPRGGSGRAPVFVTGTGGGLRVAHVAVPGAAPVVATERLRALEPAARDARSLTVHAHPSGATAWSLDLAAARLTVVISPQPSRGLSGEGALLENLMSPEPDTSAVLLAALRGNAVAPATELAAAADVAPREAQAQLARLASAGRVGYDLLDGGFFHRELPFGRRREAPRTPRLDGARSLVDGGRVRIESREGDRVTAVVGGRDGDYLVTLTPERATCSCPWHARHGASRGPCRHVLAATTVAAG
ncbi:MAG TPA: SWIM zinc finger family protein [Capillimicrobium sp.]